MGSSQSRARGNITALSAVVGLRRSRARRNTSNFDSIDKAPNPSAGVPVIAIEAEQVPARPNAAANEEPLAPAPSDIYRPASSSRGTTSTLPEPTPDLLPVCRPSGASEEQQALLTDLKADVIELIAIRLTTADAISLRSACTSLHVAVGEATWIGLTGRIDKDAHKREATEATARRALYRMRHRLMHTVYMQWVELAEQARADRTGADAVRAHGRERAAFRRMCRTLTRQCRQIANGCLATCEGLYDRITPVGTVTDAVAEEAFFAIETEVCALRTTEWWTAFAESDRRVHGYDSVAAHLDRIVPPNGLRAALDAPQDFDRNRKTVPMLEQAADMSKEYRRVWHTGSSFSSGRMQLQSLVREPYRPDPHQPMATCDGGKLGGSVNELREALQPRSADARRAWADSAEAARVAAEEKARMLLKEMEKARLRREEQSRGRPSSPMEW